MAHRQQTPVMMISATVYNDAVRIAGAEVGLRKPEEIGSLADAIARLLNIQVAGRSSSIP
jgi:hypothetical protein